MKNVKLVEGGSKENMSLSKLNMQECDSLSLHSGTLQRQKSYSSDQCALSWYKRRARTRVHTHTHTRTYTHILYYSACLIPLVCLLVSNLEKKWFSRGKMIPYICYSTHSWIPEVQVTLEFYDYKCKLHSLISSSCSFETKLRKYFMGKYRTHTLK